MDYTELAQQFKTHMHLLQKAKVRDSFGRDMGGEGFLLHQLAHHDGNVLPGRLSRMMNISSARVTATLGQLESKGLITRRIDQTDRRRVLVDLTPKGREAAKAKERALLDEVARILKLLGEDDAREMVRIMGKLANVLINQPEGSACSKS